MTQENPKLLLEMMTKERDRLDKQRMNLPKCPVTGYCLDRTRLQKLSARIAEITAKIAPPGL